MLKKTRLLTLSAENINTKLLPFHVSGYESMAKPYKYTITLNCSNQRLATTHFIQSCATLSIGNNDTHYIKRIHGHIRYCETHDLQHDGSQVIVLTLEPWLVYLKQINRYRIYYDKTVVDILHIVFGQYHMAKCRTQLVRQHTKKHYVVQYNETDFDFVSRLCEREGIYYYFVTEKNDQNSWQHVMILEDIGQARQHYHQPLIYQDEKFFSPCVTSIIEEQQHVANKVIEKHFDSKHGPQVTHHTAQAKPKNTKLISTIISKFNSNAAGSNYHVLSHLANLRLLQTQIFSHNIIVQHQYHDIKLAQQISIKNCPQHSFNSNYHVVSLCINAHDNSELAYHKINDTPTDQHFQSIVGAVPANKRFVTPWQTPLPRACTELAVVIGPKDNEIHTNKYREIQIHYPWDKDKKEKNTFWLSVLQPIQNENHCMQFTPKVGDEVIVDYLQNDPEQPRVIGSVYNNKNLPPFQPEQHPFRSGMKSHSINSHHPDAGNIIRFDDSNEKAEIYIKAQRNLSISAKSHRHKYVKGNSTTTIKTGNYTNNTQGILTIRAKDEIRIGNDKTNIIITPDGVAFNSSGTIKFIKTTSHTKKTPSEITSPTDHNQSIPPATQPQAITPPPCNTKKNENEITLQTIHVIPKWRKILPSSLSYQHTSLATILRLPDALQYQIITQLLKHFTPAAVADVPKLTVPQHITDWTQFVDDCTRQKATQALCLNNTPALNCGWIYVFTQCNTFTKSPYPQMSLYKEYFVTSSFDNQHNLFHEVDLSQHAGTENRPFEKVNAHSIDLPYQHTTANTIIPNSKCQTIVMYSQSQLSWPRIQSYGGFSSLDPRLNNIQNALQRAFINKVQQLPTQPSYLRARAGDIIPANQLDAVYQVQYEQKNIQYIDSTNTHHTKHWQQHCIYYNQSHTTETQITKKQNPVLLLDDPVGMVLEGNKLIISAQNLLKIILADLPKKTDKYQQTHFQSAAFSMQLFRTFDCSTFVNLNSLYWWLDATPRAFLHCLIADIQQINTDILLQKWDSTHQQPLPIKKMSLWDVDIDCIYQDFFAQSTERFGEAYGQLQGLIGPICMDSTVVDIKLCHQKTQPPLFCSHTFPAGLAFIQALEQPSFPLHNCFFATCMKEDAETIYLQATGQFNKLGLSYAWHNSPLETNTTGINQLFALCISNFIAQANQACYRQHTVNKIQHSYDSRYLYLQLLSNSVDFDYAQEINHLLHTMDTNINHNQWSISGNINTTLGLSFKHIAPSKNAATLNGSGILSCVLANWQIRDSILANNATADNAKLSIGLRKLAFITTALIQSKNALIDTQGALDYLFSKEQWLTRNQLNNFSAIISEMYINNQVSISGLLLGFGMMANTMNIANTTLDLFNTVVGLGESENTAIIAPLFARPNNLWPRSCSSKTTTITPTVPPLFLTETISTTDTVLFIGLTSIIINNIKHNIGHQAWLKQSIFSKPYNPYYQWKINAKSMYDCLINTLLQPQFNGQLLIDNNKDKIIKLTTNIPALYGLLNNKFIDMQVKTKFTARLFESDPSSQHFYQEMNLQTTPLTSQLAYSARSHIIIGGVQTYHYQNVVQTAHQAAQQLTERNKMHESFKATSIDVMLQVKITINNNTNLPTSDVLPHMKNKTNRVIGDLCETVTQIPVDTTHHNNEYWNSHIVRMNIQDVD